MTHRIKTFGPVRDKDIRALLLFREAIRISTPRMLRANLEFTGLSISDEARVKEHQK